MSSHGVPRSERDRSPEQLKRDLEKIEKYRALESQLRRQLSETQFDSTTLDLTTKVLRINPEYYTVWNTRRRCLISGPLATSFNALLPLGPELYSTGGTSTYVPHTLSEQRRKTQPDHEEPYVGQPRTTKDTGNGAVDALDIKKSSEVILDELAFTVPLLMAHPKCYWIWNYRMWTLEHATLLLPLAVAKSIWQNELGLVSKMLGRDRRNYHAWAYRRYVISQLESDKLEGQSLAESEFAYTTKMIENDLSNFSAWHNRAQLIPKLLSERKADDTSRRAFLDKEFLMVGNGLNVGPDDQSLWYYHEYLILNVAEQPEKMSLVCPMPPSERIKLISREIEFIKDLLEDYDDVKWIFKMLLEYTLLLHKLRNRPLSGNEKGELESWVAQIKRLDPQRSNRWNELAEELCIAS